MSLHLMLGEGPGEGISSIGTVVTKNGYSLTEETKFTVVSPAAG